MYKFFVSAFVLFFSFSLCSFGASPLETKINGIVNADPLSKTAVVSVSVRDLKTGEVLVNRDASLLLHPASTLKVITSAPIFNTWGRSYDIKTVVYRFKNDLYIKVFGDPLLTSEQLKSTLASLNLMGVDNVYVDAESVDAQNIGVGWMWDDALNPFTPRYSAFNLDKNLATIKIIPTDMGVQVPSNSAVKVENNLVKGEKNSFKVLYKPWIDPEKVFLEGMVATEQEIKIPVLDPQQYFLNRLKENFPISTKTDVKKTHPYAIVQTSIRTPFSTVLHEINSKSNNLAAESMLKLFAFTQSARVGTTQNGINLVLNFYKNLGVDTSKVQIVDASGVSHNNLVSADFMSNALYKIQRIKDFAGFKQSLAQPGKDGSLKNRLTDVPSLYAKTGTIAGVSNIVGYSDKYAFAIFIQNCKGSDSAAKNLEDKIVRTIAK